MFIHRLSGPYLQVSTCSKLYFVLVFKCLYTDCQDHTYKLVHVVNWASSFGILLKFKHNDLWHSIMVWSHLVDCSCVPVSKQEEYMCQNRVISVFHMWSVYLSSNFDDFCKILFMYYATNCVCDSYHFQCINRWKWDQYPSLEFFITSQILMGFFL
jgi:hypothetical protein